MLKIRLKRVGRKHDPSFRIVVTEKHRGPKSGKYIENLGHYDPRRDIREVKADRVKHWIGVGAQVSDTVHNILVKEGVVDGKAKNVLPKKSPIVKEEEKVAEASSDAPVQETPSEESTEAPSEEAQAEGPKEETPPAAEQAPAEETPAEEAPAEESKEEEKPTE